MFGTGAAWIAGAAVAALLTWFWFGLPLIRKVRDESSGRR
jgi:hypothetical protein